MRPTVQINAPDLRRCNAPPDYLPTPIQQHILQLLSLAPEIYLCLAQHFDPDRPPPTPECAPANLCAAPQGRVNAKVEVLDSSIKI
jgi:hypothetical protein